MEGLEDGSGVPCSTSVQEPSHARQLALHEGQHGCSRTLNYSIDFMLDVLMRLEELGGKAVMGEKWLNWLLGGDVEITRAGKHQCMLYLTVAVWVEGLWDQVLEDLIRDSSVKSRLFGCQEEDALHKHLRETVVKGAPWPANAEATGLIEMESDAEC